MNPWPFVIAAYAIAITVTAALIWRSWAAMRSAEARVEELTRK